MSGAARSSRRRLAVVICLSSQSREAGCPNPGPGSLVAGLERCDSVRVLQRETDLVQPLQQRVAPQGLDSERHLGGVRRDHDLAFEIDGHAGVAALALLRELLDLLGGQDHGEYPVLKTIVGEDVAKARSDDAADPGELEGPDRTFARGATSEVVARDKDRRV